MDNREMILNSALRLFSARGYDAVGVQEIVETAGVTKPTLYYHFGSKQGLLEEILRTNSEGLEQELLQAVEGATRVPEMLQRVARTYFDFAYTHRQFYQFMLSQMHAGQETEGFCAVFPWVRRYYQIIVQAFMNSAEELGNMQGRQEQFAVSFMGILDYYLLLQRRDLNEQEVEAISDHKIYEIVRQFLYGIYT